MDELEPEASFFNNRFLNYQQLLFTGTVHLKKKNFKQDQRKKEQSQLNFVIFK